MSAKTGWVAITGYDKVTKLYECSDVMECIDGPGDYGWAAPLDGGAPVIAHYEQFAKSKEEARQAMIAQCKRQIAKACEKLAYWEAYQ